MNIWKGFAFMMMNQQSENKHTASKLLKIPSTDLYSAEGIYDGDSGN